MANDFKTKYGFNDQHFPFVQILGKPSELVTKIGEIDQITYRVDMPSKTSYEGVKSFFASKAGADTLSAQEAQAAAWENVMSQRDKLWTARPMYGAEYERGGFEATVAAYALKGNLVSRKLKDVEVTSRQFPSQQTLNDLRYDGVAKTLQQSWRDAYRVRAKDTVTIDVTIVAPANIIDAAEEMVRFHWARDTQEMPSHRGIGFTEAVVYQSLTDGQKKRVGDFEENVGWFDLASGVFVTIDDDMAAKVKYALDADDEAQPETPARRASLWPKSLRWHGVPS